MSDHPQTTVLSKLEDENVFSVTRDGDQFVVQECCDNYYELILSADDLRRLASELIEMSKAESQTTEDDAVEEWCKGFSDSDLRSALDVVCSEHLMLCEQLALTTRRRHAYEAELIRRGLL